MLLGSDIAGVGDWCLGIEGGSDPLILCNRIHDGKNGGVRIEKGGKGKCVGNDIYGHNKFCFTFEGGSDHLATFNRIHDGATDGVNVIDDGTWARLEYNELWGCGRFGMLIEKGASAEVTGVIVRDNRDVGVVIHGPSQGRVIFTACEVCRNMGANLAIQGGSDARILSSFIHDVVSEPRASLVSKGVHINGAGMRGELRGTHLYCNQGGDLSIVAGAAPLIVGNWIHDGPTFGIVIALPETRPVLRQNFVWGHRYLEVLIQEGAAPILELNHIHDGLGDGIIV